MPLTQPLTTFPGKPSARKTHWQLMAAFMAFLTPSLAFAILYPQKGGLIMGGICTLFWLIVIAFCLINLAAAYSTVTISEEGIETNGP